VYQLGPASSSLKSGLIKGRSGAEQQARFHPVSRLSLPHPQPSGDRISASMLRCLIQMLRPTSRPETWLAGRRPLRSARATADRRGQDHPSSGARKWRLSASY
jgi:hypothetical protein